VDKRDLGIMLSRLDRSPLLTFLALYVAVIVIASLYPFSGWLGLEDWSAEYLVAPLPRYITRHDLTTNLLVYLPIGYVLALLWTTPHHRIAAILLATGCAGLLSAGLEGLQQLLPGRIASNLDVYLNALGGLVGALLALHHGRWLRGWRAFLGWRREWFRPHGPATPGLWLLLLWAFTQFALLPMPGVGWLDLHLRPIDSPPDSLTQINYAWFAAVFLEMAALGAYASCLLRPGRYVSGILLLFLVTFLLKLMAAAALLKLKVMGGILSLETLSAFLLASWLLLLPAVSRHRARLAALLLALIVGLRLVYVDSPFWPGGSLLNIVGLAAHIAALWPWLALTQMFWARRSRGRPGQPAGVS
jgi:VanZ family protein